MAKADSKTKWRPGPTVLLREAVLLQRRVSDAIRSARPRVPRPGNNGPVGGSLSSRARSRGLLKVKDSSVTVAWSKLTYTFRFFVRGTKRQKARKVKLAPTRNDLLKKVEADGFEHFKRLEEASNA